MSAVHESDNGRTFRTRQPDRWMSALRGIVLKKSFSGEERKFPGPLMLFVRRDVRDHIVSYKNDHGPSYQRYRAVQR